MSRYNRARTLLKPVAPKPTYVEDVIPQEVVDWSILDRLETITTFDMELHMPLQCVIKGSVVTFSAFLTEGKQISVTPVMPKSELDGSVLSPADGEEGYLTISRSPYCKLLCDSAGRLTFSIRPIFKDWESVADRAKRLSAT